MPAALFPLGRHCRPSSSRRERPIGQPRKSSPGSLSRRSRRPPIGWGDDYASLASVPRQPLRVTASTMLTATVRHCSVNRTSADEPKSQRSSCPSVLQVSAGLTGLLGSAAPRQKLATASASPRQPNSPPHASRPASRATGPPRCGTPPSHPSSKAMSSATMHCPGSGPALLHVVKQPYRRRASCSRQTVRSLTWGETHRATPLSLSVGDGRKTDAIDA